MESRKRYTKEFKREAVTLPTFSGKPGHEIEDDLGLDEVRSFGGDEVSTRPRAVAKLAESVAIGE